MMQVFVALQIRFHIIIIKVQANEDSIESLSGMYSFIQQ